MSKSLLVFTLVILMCSFVPGALVQWAVNGHWYEAIAAKDTVNGITWTQAQQQAQLRGGYLATLTSAAENQFVYYNSGANDASLWFLDDANNWQGPWLGGYQLSTGAEPAGGWVWNTGEAWSYTNWASGEPNNYGGAEDYLQYFWQGGTNPESVWNDVSNSGLLGYVVEYDIPEPTGILLMLASLPFLRYCRR